MTRSPPGSEARLNLGCGTLAPQGWVNVDGSWGSWLARHPLLRSFLRKLGIIGAASADARWPGGIRILDLRKPLPFGDGTFGAIYASHLLEHLHLEEARRLLKECHRVARPGAAIRVVVPDLRELIREYLGETRGAPARADLEGLGPADRLMTRMALRSPAPPTGGAIRKVHGALRDFQSHKWMYDAESLTRRIQEAGFEQVETRACRQSRIPGIEDVEDPSRVLNGEGIVVEGLKPGSDRFA